MEGFDYLRLHSSDTLEFPLDTNQALAHWNSNLAFHSMPCPLDQHSPAEEPWQFPSTPPGPPGGQSSQNPKRKRFGDVVNEQGVMGENAHEMPRDAKRLATVQSRRGVVTLPMTLELTADARGCKAGFERDMVGDRLHEESLISPPPSPMAVNTLTHSPMSEPPAELDNSPRDTSGSLTMFTTTSHGVSAMDAKDYWTSREPVSPSSPTQVFSSLRSPDTSLDTGVTNQWDMTVARQSSTDSPSPMQSIHGIVKDYKTRVETATDASDEHRENSDASTLDSLEFLLDDVELGPCCEVSDQVIDAPFGTGTGNGPRSAGD